MKLGYEYLVISDHSKQQCTPAASRWKKVIQQHKEIEQLNVELAPSAFSKV